jgi:carboxypeptidase Taq
MQHHMREQARILHDPSRDIDALLSRAEAQASNLDDWERGNLARMRHIYTHQSGFLKPGLIERYEQTLAEAEHDWAATLDIDDPAQAFAAQVAPFENALAVIRESVAEPARRMGVKPSEAALDLLNPGMTNAQIDRALTAMKADYPGLVAAIRAQDAQTPAPLSAPAIPSAVQLRIFARIRDEMLAAAGWDDNALQQAGITLHPMASTQTGFCWGSSKNIRLSIETTEDALYRGIGNTWHEVGHMLYLLHMSRLPPQAQDRPVAQFNGFGAHETAAMFMEQAGMRHKAMQLVAPIIHDELARAKAQGLLPAAFDVSDPSLSADNLYRQANRPQLDDMEWGTSELALVPQMAWRVEALRKLIDGDMRTRDLPQFWARSMKDWTGIDHDPADFRIDESHVFEGLGGYFWAYMTGAFTAAGLQKDIAAQAVAHDKSLPAGARLAGYVKLYSDVLEKRLFADASKRPALETLRRALNGGDPNGPAAYMDRLGAATRPDMPAPDEVLAGAGARRPPGPAPSA